MATNPIIETRFVIARNIKYRRMALGMTQSALGDRVFLGPKAISDREVGKRSIDAEDLPRFAAALEVQVSELFETGRFYRD